MKAILKGWNVMRFLRLILGAYIVVQGIISKDAISIVLGLVLGGMAFANIGCCGTNGCAINTPPASESKAIPFEELDSKK
jgi:hypothetical protein